MIRQRAGVRKRLSPTRKALEKQRQKAEWKKLVLEKKAEQTSKRQLEISPTSDTKKDAKKQKNEKDTASSKHAEHSDESDKEGDTTLEKLEDKTAKEQGIPELLSSESESDGQNEKNGQKDLNYKEIINKAKQKATAKTRTTQWVIYMD